MAYGKPTWLPTIEEDMRVSHFLTCFPLHRQLESVACVNDNIAGRLVACRRDRVETSM